MSHFRSISIIVAITLIAVSPLFAQISPPTPTPIAVTPTMSASVSWSEIVAKDAEFTAAGMATTIPAPFHPAIGDMPIDTAPAPSAAASAGSSTSSAPGLPSAPALCTGFQAVPMSTNIIPPDTHGSVGPGHLLTTLNTQVRIQLKNGATVSTVSLLAFWQTAFPTLNDVFDPRSIYDATIGRFIFIAAAQRQSAASSMLLAVSQSSDPTGNWNMYQYDGDAGNLKWVDYPMIGVSAQWITVTANMFANSNDQFQGVNVWTIGKSAAAAGTAAPGNLFFTSGFGGTIFPCLQYSATEMTQYLVSTWSSAGNLRVFSITGPVGAPVFNANGLPASTPWSFNFADAPQLGSSALIDTGDDRMAAAVLRNGLIYCTHAVALPVATPTHVAVKWWIVNPMTSTTVQSGVIDNFAAGGLFYYRPSLTANSNGEVMVGFTGSSPTTYAGGYYTYRSASTPLNTMQAVAQLVAGQAPYALAQLSNGVIRWGDYSATCVDPSDDLTMWTIQEYASSPQDTWATWWGSLAQSSAPISLAPSGATAGDPSTIVTISGSGFSSLSTVLLNGSPTSTTFVSSNSLQFTISTAMLVNPATLAVAVANPGVCNSAAANFVVAPLELPSACASGVVGVSVNGSTGGGTRRVDVDVATPWSITIAKPFAVSPANFILWAYIGVPPANATFSVSGVAGNMCFSPCPADPFGTFVVATSYPTGPCPPLLFGTPAPFVINATPLPFPFRLTLGGVIEVTPGVLVFMNDVIANIR